MTNLQAKIEEMVKLINPADAEYILADQESKIKTALRFEAKGKMETVENIIRGIEKYALDFDSQFITPANVKVGDGVTMHLYSDAHAGTVVKVTKTTITVQRDKAILNPEFTPEVVAGGFSGHCTNQDEQAYTYERCPEADTVTFKWSKKYNRFQGTTKGYKLSKGRHEFYDYNF